MKDPFFEPVTEGEWNACVGLQGSEESYVDGYIEAAITLVSAAVNHPESCDTLAMPILFNGRHAIELSLKFVIARLCEVEVLVPRAKTDHDISSYLDHLTDEKIGDKTIRNVISALRPFVKSLASIDSDGQQLRYAKTREGKTSLENVTTINLLLVKDSLLVLRKTLAMLRDRVEEFINERDTGAFTRECSRKDLLEILAILGRHSTWVGESFMKRKKDACARFNLTGRQFSKAVDKIKSSRELGGLVGIEQNLMHLSDEKAVIALSKWHDVHSSRLQKMADGHFDWPNFNQLREISKKKQDLREFIASLLTIDEFSDLCALFYLGRDLRYGELYDSILEYTRRRFHFETYSSHIDYLISKATLLKNVIHGVKRAGRPSLALQLQGIGSKGKTT